jgi:hypothetical protein
MRACRPAQALPQGGLAAPEIARLWARDRFALAQCAGRLSALAGHVRGQEAAASEAAAGEAAP